MKVLFSWLLFLVTCSTFAQQIVPGTWSYRTGANGTVSNPPVAGPSDYYNMTSWDSSPYQPFRLHKGTGTPDASNFWINFRLLFPTPYTSQPQQKYPLIVMLHGLGEAGIRGSADFPAYDVTDPRYLNNDHNLFHGGFKHLQANQTQEFPGFIVVPQNNTQWTIDNLEGVAAMIERLIAQYPIDQYRIYLHGYSNGGDGAWKLAEMRPDLFAALLPMSWIYFELEKERVLHIPTWYFQGELDERPLASSARFTMTQLEELGGTPRYTEYENAGHAIWDRAYAEPDFFSWMLGKNKTDIMAYYGRTSVCPGENVNIRLGVSPGFLSYQWRIVTDQGEEILPVGGPENNELVAQKTGNYYVRFSRSSSPGSGNWSPWSKPLAISVEDNLVPPDIILDGSPHLPSPDGRQSVTLSVPDSYGVYQWYRNGTAIQQANTSQITTSQAGRYTVFVSPVESCPSVSADTVQITVNATTPSIGAPSNLTVTAVSEVALQLSWQDNATNEAGFEIYRALNPNGPYALVKEVPGNTTMVKDSSLLPATTYYYRMRAFTESGVSALSNTASARTFEDTSPPSTPGLLTYKLRDVGTVELNWGASTDNSDLIIYQIIVNGQVVATTQDTTFTLTGLTQETLYTITIRARDRANNVSDHSNQVSVKTVFEGVAYRYYYGGLWTRVDDYANWPVEKEGFLPEISIATESAGGVRPDPQVNYFAFDFEGYLYIENAGEYIFSLEAAAGSILNVGNLEIDNDGQHGPLTEVGKTNLGKGPVSIYVRFYDRTENEVLNILYSGPDTGNELIPIPEEALTSSKKTFPDPPATPTGFEATNISLRGMDLSWTDEATNESGYEVLRAKNMDGPFVKIVKTSANVEMFADDNLTPLTTYHYLVRAVGPSGTSEFDSLSATTGLPLASFETTCGPQGNVITWTQKALLSQRPFYVEQSVDNSEFKVIGRVNVDAEDTLFSWTDNVFKTDTTVYRIRQQSTGGGSGFSETIEAVCSPVDFQLLADIYPNPLENGLLTIRMRNILPDQPIEVTVMDNIGRIHYKNEFALDPELSPFVVDLTAIGPKGLYILLIRQGGESYQQKIIVDKQ